MAKSSYILFEFQLFELMEHIKYCSALGPLLKGIKKVYRKKRNITTSAYLGDLLVTAYSQFSRNRMLGNMLGKGSSVKYALLNMTMVAEGYYASKCINAINKDVGAKIPIADAMYNILYNGVNPADEIETITGLLK